MRCEISVCTLSRAICSLQHTERCSGLFLLLYPSIAQARRLVDATRCGCQHSCLPEACEHVGRAQEVALHQHCKPPP